ncbi:hypothetical protein MLD38_000907 [Melastoma candidum]|uniref:Uncharacterized protein n=1 Tax=Melastoma candidum TaxID=119954 RepID=A0ACB9SGH4_9MYRT|nr:hypothetical protein MLD38_000907 [Melastoma candidum]
MEIIQKLIHYKYHLLFLLLAVLVLSFLVFLAPSFLTVVAYFWPLLVSTGLFLVAVVVFGKTSAAGSTSSSSSDNYPSSMAGEGILDYVVAGPTEQHIEQPVAAAGSVEAEVEGFKAE